MLASKPNNEVKHEIEINSIAILKELKLFFMDNKYRISEPQNCTRYNSVLEIHNAELVYDEEERIHKLWVNDESLEPQSAIQMLTAIIAFLEALNARNPSGTPAVSNSMSAGSTAINACAAGDVITIIGDVTAGGALYIGGNHKHKHYDKPILDEAALNAKETQALSQLKASYSIPEYTTIPGIFGPPLKLEGQYINLQILCTDLKTKKTEEDKESKESAETKHDEKYKDARMASVEDLFGDKRAIKAENLFKPVQELFDNQALETVKDANEVPRLLLVQGRAGIGKTTFVRYAAHQWSKGQLYANYTWVFTLTLRKLHLLPNTSKPTLEEWVQKNQFSDWKPKEFEQLWRQRIEPAIDKNEVLLMLDGYDEMPENHPYQLVLNNLLTAGGKYPNLAVLLTTRPCSLQDITERRRNLEIIGFMDENINQYIQNYFLSTPDKTLVNTLRETLQKQPVIWANAHIPLNLNLLCGIMGEAIQKANARDLNQALMHLSSMTRLYEVMEKKLYERAYARHDRSSNKAGAGLMGFGKNFVKLHEEERLFMAQLAFQSFQAEHIIIRMQTVGAALQAHVNKKFTQVSGKNGQLEKEKLGAEFFESVCGLGLIKSVLDSSSLSQAGQDYEFLHLTFQEYYTAIYIAEGLSGTDKSLKIMIEKILLKEKYNPRWQIVWWFVAGLLRENTVAYRDYLEQLQGRIKGQMLTQDIFEHYQLGLLARCIDEGFGSQNQQTIEPIVKQLQLSFLRFYQINKNISSYDFRHLLVASAFFAACRISPNLCMNEKQDLYALIPEPAQEEEDRDWVLSWIYDIKVVTPKMLSILAYFLGNGHYKGLEIVAALGSAVATPQILDMLSRLLSAKNSHVWWYAAEAVGNLGAVAATPQILDALLPLAANKNFDVSYRASRAVNKLVAAAAMPQILDALLRLLADKESNVRCNAAKMVGNLGAVAATPQILDALLRLLADKESSVRCNAAEAVGKLGAVAATPQILNALSSLLADDKDNSYGGGYHAAAVAKLSAVPGMSQTSLDLSSRLLANEDRRAVRYTVAEAAANLGAVAATPQILDVLLGLLADSDWEIRYRVAKVVGKLTSVATIPQVLARLLRLLADKESNVRRNAAEAVGELGAVVATPQIFDALLRLLADKESNVRRDAAEAVGKLGAVAATPQILDALLQLLADKESSWYAVKAVGKLGAVAATPQILDALLRLLADKESNVRRNAAEAVGELGAVAAMPQILDALLRLLADKESNVRRDAAEAVGKLGAVAATPQILGALLRLLADKESDVRCNAAEAVGNLGAVAATPQILDQLLRLLVDKDSDRFAVAVGKLGIAVVTPQILLADKDRDVRYRAAEAVGKLGAAAAKPEILDTLYTLSSLLADESWGVRDYAARVLAKLGVAGILQVLNTLSRFSAGKNEHVCRYAIEAVANLGPAVATPQIMYTLQRLLTDEDSYVRRQTAKVIGTLGAAAATSEILAMLPRLLLDENKYVRCNTAETVGKLGAAAATPEILDALQRLLVLVDEGICAMQAIANLGAASLLPRTLDELPRLLVDEDRGVRLIATRAVGKLGAAVATPEILNTLQRELLNNFQHFLFEVSYSYDGHEQFGWCYNRFGWRHDYEYQYDGWWDDEWYRDEYHDCLNNLRKCTLYKLVKEASISEVLHWFLNMFSAPEIKNDEVLPILQICLSSAFIFIPSFWLENANHRNMFVFLSHVLAVAYFNNQISCQVYFDEDAQLKSYYMRGFIGKFSYSVPVMPIQAECLRELSGLIIEQLSKTGKLDIAELKARLPKWNEAVQELLSSKHKSSSLKAADPGSVPNLQDHIVPSTSRQPQPRMLTQYHQFTPPASVVVENPKQIVETEQPVKNLKIVNKQNVGKDLREHTAPHTSEQKSPRMLTQSQLAIPAIATVGNPKQVIKTDELARAASQNEVTVRNTSRVSQLKKLYEK